jgi:trimeric autotransporter adhesin
MPIVRMVLALLVVVTLVVPGALAQERVGVNTAVNPDASGTSPGAVTRRLVLGMEVVHNEHITTGPGGQTQILFVDESAMTVGPDADMTIDDFVFDPNSSEGQLAMSATKGVLRFVGGQLSKRENAVSLKTPSGTIGVRGGIFVMTLSPTGKLQVVFLYGKGLTVTDNNVTQTITRPGYSITVRAPGETPSSPTPTSDEALASLLGQLSGKNGATGGSNNIPTDQSVVSSGVSNTLSSNINTSVQQAAQGMPKVSPQPVNVTTVQSSADLNTISTQGAPPIVASAQNPTPPGTPIKTTPSSPTPAPPILSKPQPVTIQIAGLVKSTNGPNTGFGFTDQTVNGRIPYSSGTISYPAGSVLQNGTVTITIPNLGQTNIAPGQATLAPLTPGSATAVTVTGSDGGTATGTAFTNADSTFFYANLLGSNGVSNAFVFGGVPVNQSFYAPTPSQQILAFSVQPDAALANGAQAQTIPFLPSLYGGTMPNVTVSPLYLVTPANTQFGSYNANTNPNVNEPQYLQASLAISGQGANQTSAFLGTTGSFDTSNDDQVYGSGQVRGVVSTNATAPLVRIGSAASTVPDGNGNSLYGSSALAGFVLDQNQYNGGNFVPALASATQYGASTTATNYAFNQPVTAATVPSNVGVTRSALNESGYFGGIMQTNAGATSYVLTGTASVQSDPTTSRVAATFAGADPFTSAQSGLASAVLQFGSLPSQGSNGARSTFIDNNIYAALENYNVASQITTTNGTTTTLPTPASGSALSPQLAMVTSATVPNAIQSLLPSGVTPCACQYLQWGYWTADVGTPNTAGTGYSRVDQGAINTWIAGMPTVTMPTTGVGTYNGAAVGTVFNNGATYLAAGGLNQTYNFGSLSGTLNITNFDGANYTSSVSGSGNAFAGSLTGPANRSGAVFGKFYGPSAVETGGTFNIQSTTGLKYLASGIFAGH